MSIDSFVKTHVDTSPYIIYVELDKDNQILESNVGFDNVSVKYGCEDDPISIFRVPRIDKIRKKCEESDTQILKLAVTVGPVSGFDMTSYQCQVALHNDSLVIIGEIDMEEVTAMTQEYQTVSKEIPELQRALIKRNKIVSQLEDSLDERSVLLRETNHRVKNNLFILSSLVSAKAENAPVSEILGQIEAFRILHEQLSGKNSTDMIELKEYFQTILTVVFDNSPVDADIELNIDVGPTRARIAGSFGLMVNELATNAIKHAFSPDEKNVFSLAMRVDEKTQQCIFISACSGNQFPEGVDINTSQSTGMHLIRSLTGQLGGRASIERGQDNQSAIVVVFPMVSL